MVKKKKYTKVKKSDFVGVSHFSAQRNLSNVRYKAETKKQEEELGVCSPPIKVETGHPERRCFTVFPWKVCAQN